MNVIQLQGDGTFPMPVVGESHYQDALESICGKRKKDGEEKTVRAILVPEPTNPYDPSAVKVEIAGKQVGYLSRDMAQWYHGVLQAAGLSVVSANCTAQIRGGWDRGRDNRGHYGVWLDVLINQPHITGSRIVLPQSTGPKIVVPQGKSPGRMSRMWQSGTKGKAIIIIGAMLILMCLCSILGTPKKGQSEMPVIAPTAAIMGR